MKWVWDETTKSSQLHDCSFSAACICCRLLESDGVLIPFEAFEVTLDRKLSFDQHVNNTCRPPHPGIVTYLVVAAWSSCHDRRLQRDFFPPWLLQRFPLYVDYWTTGQSAYFPLLQDYEPVRRRETRLVKVLLESRHWLLGVLDIQPFMYGTT